MQKRRTEKKSILGYIRPTLMMSAFFMCVAIVLLKEHVVLSQTKDAFFSMRGETMLSNNTVSYKGGFPTNKTLETICRLLVFVFEIFFSILLKVATVMFVVGAIISVPKLLNILTASIKRWFVAINHTVHTVVLSVYGIFFKITERKALLTTCNLN